MRFKFNRKTTLVMFITLLVAYLIFYLTMILSDLLIEHHSIFTLTVLFLVTFCLLTFSVQERSYYLKLACIIQMSLVLFEFTIELLNIHYPELIHNSRLYDIVFHVGMSINLIAFAFGFYKEMIQKQKLDQLNMVAFKYNEAVYFEYFWETRKIKIEFSPQFLKKYNLKNQILSVSHDEFQSYVHPEDLNQISFYTIPLKQNEMIEKKIRVKFPKMSSYIYLILKGSFSLKKRFGCLGFDVSALELANQILESKTTEYDLLDEERRKIVENSRELFVKVDLKGTIVFASENYARMFDMDVHDIVGQNLFEISRKHGNYNHSWFPETINNHNTAGQSSITTKNKTVWVSWNNDVLLDKDGNVEYVICVGHDITDLVKLNQDLEYRSLHNTLTGLLNYHGFYETINQLDGVNSAVSFFIEISNFAMICNYYGIQTGDLILKKVADDLREYVDRGHLVSRYFGETFVLLLINPIDAEIYQTLVKLKDSILTTIRFPNATVQLKNSIGYACYPDDTNNLTQLVSLSSLAMWEAKNSEHNVIVKYENSMSERLKENVKLAQKIYNAIENSQIDIYFQKIINAKTNEVAYVESLARWFDPEMGSVRPDVFIKTAKQSNLIDMLDEYLVRKAIEKFAILRRDPSYQNTKLAVNLAPSSFLRDDVASIIEQFVSEYGLTNQDICIEISENTFVHNISICQYFLSKYKKCGFLIAIDDFGREYSSLSILEKIDFDIIKIDGSFVSAINSPKNRAIVEMVIEIAKYENKGIIAESVEDRSASEQLKALECYMQQGYYFHRPEKLV